MEIDQVEDRSVAHLHLRSMLGRQRACQIDRRGQAISHHRAFASHVAAKPSSFRIGD